MPGLKTVIPVSFTDTSLPIVQDDPILADGSLMLIDVGHSLGGWPVGVPANGALIRNVAWQQAAAVVGSGTETTLSSTVESQAGWSGGKGVLERTPKGGLHGIPSRTLADGTTQLQLALPSLLQTYLRTNPTRNIYHSTWYRLTRTWDSTVTGGNGTTIEHTTASAASTNYKAILGVGGHSAAGGVQRRVGGVGLGNAIATQDSPGAWVGTAPTDNASYRFRFFLLGSAGAWAYTDALRRAKPAIVYYRTYVEDLTTSGRTWAEVDALDYAAYQAAFSVGGRFYGDTLPTDPATVA
jgi:hypothetical protein